MSALQARVTVRPKKYAEMKGVHRQTVYTWIYQRLIPCVKVRGSILIDPIEADEALSRFKLKV